jgi:MOSC domain-containing protein YiiM
VRESCHNAGVYASVIEVGEVAEGDAVESVP